jgi:hypothetical protein
MVAPLPSLISVTIILHKPSWYTVKDNVYVLLVPRMNPATVRAPAALSAAEGSSRSVQSSVGAVCALRNTSLAVTVNVYGAPATNFAADRSSPAGVATERASDSKPLPTDMVRTPTTCRLAVAPKYTVTVLSPVYSGVTVTSYVNESPESFLTTPTTGVGLLGDLSSQLKASGPCTASNCAKLPYRSRAMTWNVVGKPARPLDSALDASLMVDGVGSVTAGAMATSNCELLSSTPPSCKKTLTVPIVVAMKDTRKSPGDTSVCAKLPSCT